MERRPDTFARIAAGLVAPVAALFIWGLSTGTPPMDLGSLGFALTAGAPLSVPVAVALAPRRLWLALPAISLAAAVGIELQMLAIFSDSWLSNALVVVWIIPATLGAGAALLLKLYDRPISHVAVGIVSVIAFAAIALGDRSAPDDPKYDAAARTWSEVRPGVKVYIGGDSDAASQTVCPNLTTYLRYEQTGKAPNCIHVAHGMPAVVESVIPCTRTDPSFGYETPRALVRAIDGTLRGVTTAGNFQPNIRPGIILKLHRDWGAPLSMVGANKQINLGTAATVRLLRYEPKADAGRTLYVRVLDGPHAGESGWTGIQLVDSGDVSLGAYDMAYPTHNCF